MLVLDRGVRAPIVFLAGVWRLVRCRGLAAVQQATSKITWDGREGRCTTMKIRSPMRIDTNLWRSAETKAKERERRHTTRKMPTGSLSFIDRGGKKRKGRAREQGRKEVLLLISESERDKDGVSACVSQRRGSESGIPGLLVRWQGLFFKWSMRERDEGVEWFVCMVLIRKSNKHE